MKIFNIFSVIDPFKTGASGSGLGVPYTIQYNMSVMGTELDGTRYIRNYGKGGNSFNATANASNHIFLNGTTQSVPYPVLHELATDIHFNNIYSTASNVTVTGSNPYNVVDSGASQDTADSIVYFGLLTDLLAGKTYQISMDVTINEGSKTISNFYNGSAVVPLNGGSLELQNGINTYEITMASDYYRHILYTDTVTAYDIDFDNVSVKEITLPTASYLTIMQADGTIKQFSADGDSGSTLAVSTTHSETASHQFVFNSTSPLTDADVSAIEADPNTAFRMFFDDEVLPSGFSNTDVGWFSGGNEGLASAEKVYDLSDQAFLTYVSIVGYDAATRTTLANQSNGASNLKLIRDASGRTTGTAAANATQWEADGRTAVTNWTITAPFTITEVIDGDTYTFTSDGNRYKNTVADGTYTLPTGIWTLDEFGFDGVTSVTARGVTRMIDEVVIP